MRSFALALVATLGLGTAARGQTTTIVAPTAGQTQPTGAAGSTTVHPDPATAAVTPPPASPGAPSTAAAPTIVTGAGTTSTPATGSPAAGPSPAGTTSTPATGAGTTSTAPTGGPAAGGPSPAATTSTPGTIRPSGPVDQSTVDRAVAAFDAGDWQTAAALFEQCANAGIVNGHLYYDLGLAEYRLGRVGDAMAAFLAARRYLPRDPDVAANLNYVLQHDVKDKLEPTAPRSAAAALLAPVDRFTAKELAWTTAVLAALAGLFLAATQLVPKLAPLRRAAWTTLALPLVAGLALAAKPARDEPWGAVTAKQARAYSGPGDRNTVVFELQEGAPVLVTDAPVQGYLQVQLSDGKKGWIADSQVRLLGPL